MLIALKENYTGILIVLFACLLFSTICLSLSMGYIQIPVPELFKAFYFQAAQFLNTPTQLSVDDTILAVMFDIRLPRILTCAAVGAALSVSGVLFQGILLNPLADPYTLGVSAGASFGAAVAILLNIGAAVVSVPIFAFAGACLTLFFVIYLSYSDNTTFSGLSSNNLILSGIIVASILSAGLSFLKFLANEQVSIIIFWLMGSFAAKTWTDFLMVLAFLLMGYGVSLFYAKDLNLISLGPKSASSLGVDFKKVILILLVTGSMLAAICVSVSGVIGFVGLLVPHMVRFITGPDNHRLLPLSALGGAFLLLLADTITRAVLPHEIPIGVLTAIIGGPVFCWIFKKSREK